MEGEYCSDQWWNESGQGGQDYQAENSILQFAFTFVHLYLTKLYYSDVFMYNEHNFIIVVIIFILQINLLELREL